METKFKPSLQDVWNWWRWCEKALEREPNSQLSEHFKIFLKIRGLVKEGGFKRE